MDFLGLNTSLIGAYMSPRFWEEAIASTETSMLGCELIDIPIVSHPRIGSAVHDIVCFGPPICPHSFIFGSSRATSQWVTHPGIVLAPTRLTSEFS
ncbi:unnamed protein product [Prunus armeniaca]